MADNLIEIPFEEYNAIGYTGICCADGDHRCYDYGLDRQWNDAPIILWQCEKCRRWFCFGNGCADNNPQLCDECYHKKFRQISF